MESAARRRLESIGRHLLPPRILSRDLHLNPVSLTESNDVGSSPVIIGGMILDIHAKPFTDPVPGTTKPGEVQYVSGGVARNIAECMSKLGTRPFMISAVGFDMAGEMLLRYWKSAGLSTEGILQSKSIRTPVVSIVFDSSGELAAAVASVEAVEKFLTPEFIKQFQSYICSAPMLILDANLHPKSIEFACQIAAAAGIPVWFEPVSVKKSTRIATVVNYITCASPNEKELIAMANALSSRKQFKFHCESTKGQRQSVESLFQMLKPAICFLLDKGIKLLIVTLGPEGVFLCIREWPRFKSHDLKSNKLDGLGRMSHEFVDESCSLKQNCTTISGQLGFKSYAFHFPALHASVVSLTGAGDCLVAGILASISSGFDMMRSVAVGIAVAKAAVESETNVPAEFLLHNIAGEAKIILSGVKQLPL
ncbi:pseudouridine kinase-like [Musa acuminata AAA Group]|uniref:pseudouridine kinase-like n=1 Tax=Musa acuminata AAA Group TaxID=214697 RepID=UPI0031D96113